MRQRCQAFTEASGGKRKVDRTPLLIFGDKGKKEMAAWLRDNLDRKGFFIDAREF
jgi:hypothetical protein